MIYTQEQLHAIQEEQYGVLNATAEILQRYNIPYILAFGSMLGAVRHQGFIPWDDDIDIAIMRKDYDRFLAVAQEELGDAYCVQNTDTDKNCLNIGFTKIRKVGTVHESKGQKHLDRCKGVGIDVFPFDPMPEKRWKQVLLYHLVELIKLTSSAKLKYNYYAFRPVKKYATLVASALLTPISISRLGKIDTWLKTRTSDKSALVDWISYAAYKTGGRMQKEWFYDRIYVPFGNQNHPIIREYKNHLIRTFGEDFMTPPPVEKRVPHPIINLKIAGVPEIKDGKQVK